MLDDDTQTISVIRLYRSAAVKGTDPFLYTLRQGLQRHPLRGHEQRYSGRPDGLSQDAIKKED